MSVECLQWLWENVINNQKKCLQLEINDKPRTHTIYKNDVADQTKTDRAPNKKFFRLSNRQHLCKFHRSLCLEIRSHSISDAVCLTRSLHLSILRLFNVNFRKQSK